MEEQDRPIGRRTLIAAIGTGAIAAGAFSGAPSAAAQSASAGDARWRPALEEQDDWMELPGRHRLVFDATSADGTGNTLFFARNYIAANGTGYDLQPSQLATIVILRHFATVFGYEDAMWAKYGATFSKMASFTDPKSGQTPTANLYDAHGYQGKLPNAGVTLSQLADDGVQFAICGAATGKIAEVVAQAIGADAAKVRDELGAHLIRNGRQVPAGIVAVNRAQERGYALAYTG